MDDDQGVVTPIFVFSVQTSPGAEIEVEEVAAPDFVKAVQALAAKYP